MTDINWQKCIDNFITSQREKMEIKKNEFRASELSGCVRSCVRSRLDLSQISVGGKRRMMAGTQMHYFIQQHVGLGHIGRPVEFEKYVQMPIDDGDGIITGHIDCWDGDTVWDFKSCSDLSKTLQYPVSIAYIYQLSFYYHAARAQKAVIVYIDKRDLSVMQVPIVPISFNEIEDFCIKVSFYEEEYRRNDSLPDKDDCYACRHEETI